MMVAMRAPKDTASARPTTDSPRIRMRRRQSINELKRAVRSQAKRIEGAVIRPSNRLVTSKMGMRMIEGNKPK